MQAPRSSRFALVWVDPSGGPLDLWPTRPFALNPPLHACVEVWQTSNLRRLRLGEEKKKKEQTTEFVVDLLHY